MCIKAAAFKTSELLHLFGLIGVLAPSLHYVVECHIVVIFLFRFYWYYSAVEEVCYMKC